MKTDKQTCCEQAEASWRSRWGPCSIWIKKIWKKKRKSIISYFFHRIFLLWPCNPFTFHTLNRHRQYISKCMRRLCNTKVLHCLHKTLQNLQNSHFYGSKHFLSHCVRSSYPRKKRKEPASSVVHPGGVIIYFLVALFWCVYFSFSWREAPSEAP